MTDRGKIVAVRIDDKGRVVVGVVDLLQSWRTVTDRTAGDCRLVEFVDRLSGVRPECKVHPSPRGFRGDEPDRSYRVGSEGSAFARRKQLPVAERRKSQRIEIGKSIELCGSQSQMAALPDGQRAILEKQSVPFTVLKALVLSGKETLANAVSMIAAGSKLDTRQVSQIRKRVRASASPIEVFEQERISVVVKAATRQAKKSVNEFEARVALLIGEAFDLVAEFDPFHDARARRQAKHASLNGSALGLLEDFDRLFGASELSPDDLMALDSVNPAYRMGAARDALHFFSESEFALFGDGFDLSRVENDLHRRLSPLFAISTITPRRALPKTVRAKMSPRTVPALPTRAPEPLSVVELCGGAGAMALGFEAAGYEHAAIFESNRNAVATMRANRPNWNVIRRDIQKVDFRPYRGVDVLTGGLPCQSFSIAGAQTGSKDERDLFTASLRAVEEIQPRAFVFENVLGFRKGKHSDYRAFLLQLFDELGYRCEIHSIDAQDYGVPQGRQRVSVVGMRKSETGVFRMPPRFPEKRVHLGDALSDLMARNGWAGAYDWAEAIGRQVILHREVPVSGAVAPTLTRMKKNPRTNQRKAWAALGIDIRWVPDTAPTEEEARAAGQFMPGLTQQMRARIQGFPDAWQFEGERGAVSQQIANAFPPVMSQAVGLAMYTALEGIEFDYEAALGRAELTDDGDQLVRPVGSSRQGVPEARVA